MTQNEVLGKLLVILIALVGVTLGVFISVSEEKDQWQFDRWQATDKMARERMLPSITVEGRTTIFTGKGELVVVEEENGG